MLCNILSKSATIHVHVQMTVLLEYNIALCVSTVEHINTKLCQLVC